MTAQSSKTSLLIVDDSPDTRELIQRHLSAEGFDLRTAGDAAEALRILGSHPIDLVVTDFKMPGASGLDLVRHVRENLAGTEIMIITGYPSVEGAVNALKSGAGDYLSKPFTKNELLTAVHRALEKLSLRKSDRLASGKAASTPLGIVGESEPMQAVFKAALKAASATTPVLITGENGTGRGLLARAIHYGSARRKAPFVTANCDGIPEDLFDRQLLGFAGKGPMDMQAGFFQLVDGGTLFLKGVAALPEHIQDVLLRVLEEKQFRMIGSEETHPVSFRVIADTRMDLRQLVNEGAFREDLFVRLSMNVIPLPALRERGNDVAVLARHFLNESSKLLGRPIPRMTDAALSIIKSYSWPGNISELQNVIYQLLLTTERDWIDVPDFPPHMRLAAADASAVNRSLADLEAEHIRRVIAAVGGNKTRAAEILGINRKTLREKLRQTGDTQSED